MKVSVWKDKSKPWRKSSPGVMVYITPTEALSLISTLALQLRNEDVNSGRVEWTPQEGASYFSVAIDFTGINTTRGLKAEYDEQVAQMHKRLLSRLKEKSLVVEKPKMKPARKAGRK